MTPTPTPSAESRALAMEVVSAIWHRVQESKRLRGANHVQAAEAIAPMLALALDAAKEQTRRDTERETVEKAAKAVCPYCRDGRSPLLRPVGRRNWAHASAAFPDCKAWQVWRAFPLVPAPAADTKEKA